MGKKSWVPNWVMKLAGVVVFIVGQVRASVHINPFTGMPALAFDFKLPEASHQLVRSDEATAAYRQACLDFQVATASLIGRMAAFTAKQPFFPNIWSAMQLHRASVAVEELFQEVATAFATIHLYGPDEVVTATRDVWVALSERLELLSQAKPGSPQFKQIYTSTAEAISPAIAAYRDAVRNDLPH